MTAASTFGSILLLDSQDYEITSFILPAARVKRIVGAAAINFSGTGSARSVGFMGILAHDSDIPSTSTEFNMDLTSLTDERWLWTHAYALDTLAGPAAAVFPFDIPQHVKARDADIRFFITCEALVGTPASIDCRVLSRCLLSDIG